jgi:hypothetical protein
VETRVTREVAQFHGVGGNHEDAHQAALRAVAVD